MTAVGVTGIPGIAIVEQGSILNYIIALVLAFAGAFAAALVLGFKEAAKTEENNEVDNEIDSEAAVTTTEEFVVPENGIEIIAAPTEGRAVSLEQVPDKTFADRLMGDGIAIDPTSGIVVAPVSEKIVHIFETKHAIAMQTYSGIELLIHIGIDTVKMNGEGFKAFIKSGDTVKVGDKLLEVDLNLVKEKATSSITSIIVTNTEKFKFVKELKRGQVNLKDDLISIGFDE